MTGQRASTMPGDDAAPPPGRPLGPLQLGLLLLSVLAGVATALAVMPTIFRHTPTDISRVGVILDVLRDAEARPAIAVFGNSVAMSGIDARRLAQRLPGEPLAWNLSSTGQSVVESALLTQALGEAVPTVVYVAMPRAIVKEVPLLPQKSNAYYLYGFRPDEVTKERLQTVYGDGVMQLLSRGAIEQAFEGRWAVRQLLDTRLRILLRRDLSLASAEVDLFHPQRYTQPVEASVLRRAVEGLNEQLEERRPQIPGRELELIRRIAKDRGTRGQTTVVLIAPLHPGFRVPHADAFADAIRTVEAEMAGVPGARVVDASSALQPEHFIDHFHPTNAGAGVLTDFLAQGLAAKPGGGD